MGGNNGEGDTTRKVRIAVDTAEKRLKRQLSLAVSICGVITALVGIAALGFRGSHLIDSKADETEVDDLNRRQAAIEATERDHTMTLQRLEQKLDWILMHLSPANTPATGPRRDEK